MFGTKLLKLQLELTSGICPWERRGSWLEGSRKVTVNVYLYFAIGNWFMYDAVTL